MQDVVVEIINHNKGVLEVYRQDIKGFMALRLKHYEFISDYLKKGTLLKISYSKNKEIYKMSFIRGGANG